MKFAFFFCIPGNCSCHDCFLNIFFVSRNFLVHWLLQMFFCLFVLECFEQSNQNFHFPCQHCMLITHVENVMANAHHHCVHEFCTCDVVNFELLHQHWWVHSTQTFRVCMYACMPINIKIILKMQSTTCETWMKTNIIILNEMRNVFFFLHFFSFYISFVLLIGL